MFTGLVEEIGKVKAVVRTEKSAQITIEADMILENIKLGDSICTNGICLTVTEFTKNSFTVDVMPETMRKTNLSHLKIGSKVNLERALRVGDRLGGHIVSGHIDGTGSIQSFKKENNAVWIFIQTEEALLRYIIEKGSIAVDGTSLTVASLTENAFSVSIIPHTAEHTILLSKNVGEEVNLECDMIGKYVEKFIRKTSTETKSSIDMEFLKTHGFF